MAVSGAAPGGPLQAPPQAKGRPARTEYQDDDLAAGHLRTFPISLLFKAQPPLALTEELVTSVIVCITKAAEIAALDIAKDITGGVSIAKATAIVLFNVPADSYLPADPRLAEAPQLFTVVPGTAAARSAAKPLLVTNST